MAKLPFISNDPEQNIASNIGNKESLNEIAKSNTDKTISDFNSLEDVIFSTTKEDINTIENNSNNNLTYSKSLDKTLGYLSANAPRYSPYTSPSVASNGTAPFKIGPITFGAEVQSIKIMEEKALASIPAARSGNDLIVDSGLGDADVIVSMIFPNKESIINGLRPLIALFRLSPITSVKNELIESALINKFTENNVQIIADKLREDAKDTLEQAAFEFQKSELKQVSGSNIINEAIFNKYRDSIPSLKVYKTYNDWINDTIKYSKVDPFIAHSINSEPTESGISPENTPSIRRLDKTNHVPMAFLSIEIKTHPELVDTLLVSLYLKRINVGNYLSNYLQYYTYDGKPTPDPNNAYWLNKAIEIYINRYISEDKLRFDDFGDINILFSGSNIELNNFKLANDLKEIQIKSNINAPGPSSVAAQVSYIISNKFAFHRLLGETFPTCQHTGVTSGMLNMILISNNQKDLEKFYTFKTAADFFARTSERIDRINGWKIDSFINRIFSFKEIPFDETSDLGGRTYYPKSVNTSTEDGSPDLRNVSITFLESDPSFFTNYGFSINKGGYNIKSLYEFYIALYNKGQAFKNILNSSILSVNTIDPFNNDINFYSYDTFFGTNEESKYNILNSDTLFATILENGIYNSKEGIDKIVTNESSQQFAEKIKDVLLNNSKISGILNPNRPGIDVVLDQIASLKDIFTIDLKLSETGSKELIQKIADNNFQIVNTNNETEKELVLKQLLEYINFLPNKGTRLKFYRWLATSNNITFTDEFINKLFAAIIKRSKVPVSDRVYNRLGVLKAYDALIVSYEAYRSKLVPELNDIPNGNKFSPTDQYIILGTDGRFKKLNKKPTCYPDYMYITFDTLFNTPDDDTNYLIYAYKYKNVGLINPNIDDYRETFDVVNAQKQPITSKDSPVPPSIFFYREDELDEVFTDLNKIHKDYFSQLSGLYIDIPFDIAFIEKDSLGRPNGNISIPDIDGNPITLKRGLSTLIEDIVKNAYKNNFAKYQEITNDIISNALKEFSKQNNITIPQLNEKRIKGLLTEDQYKQIEGLIYLNGRKGIYVPCLIGTTKDSPYAKYIKISGIGGDTIVRSIIDVTLSGKENAVFKDLVDTQITREATGRADTVSITGSELSETNVAINKIFQSVKDNNNDLIKAFPTMKLYLIEPRGPRLIVQDNFYSYNSILSIDITHDKWDSSLAVLRISDPFHILQSDSFDVEDSFSNILGDTAIATDSKDGAQQSVLDRVKLKQGRQIQIRGGYFAEQDSLDILFTGRIMEIQYGDIVTIVAQSWKSELVSKEIQFELNLLENSSLKDLVVRTIRDSNPAGFGEVYSGEELDELKNIQAELSTAEQISQAYKVGFGTTGGHASSAAGGSLSLLGFTLIEGFGAGLDTRLKNIWIPDNDRKRWNFFADISNTGWEASRWVVPLTPAWDVLQQATNYAWGYICQEVPYDGGATLFFGRPDQMYYYTDGLKYNRFAKEYREKKINQISDIMNDFSIIFNNFINSNFYINSRFLYPSLTTEQNTDAIIGTFRIHTRLKADYDLRAIIVTPQENSYELYKDMFGNMSSVEGFLDSITPSFLESPEKEALRANLANPQIFSDAYNSLSEKFSDNKIIPIMLLTYFFGFNPEYIQQNIQDPHNFLQILCSSIDQNTIDKLKIKFIDIFQPDDKDAIKNYLKEIQYTEDQLDEYISLMQDPKITDDTKDDIIMDYLTKFVVPPEIDFVETPGLAPGKKIVIDRSNRALSISRKGGGNIDNIQIPNYETLKQNVLVKLLGAKQKYNQSKKYFTTTANNLYSNEALGSIKSKLGNSSVSPDLDSILDKLHLFRAFIYFFSEYMKNITTSNSNNQEIKDIISKLADNKFDFNKSINMKVFRDFHYIRNSVDIIENNIAASTREMHNTVIVRYPLELVTTNEGFLQKQFKTLNFNDHKTTDVSSETQWTIFPNPEQGHMGLQFNDKVLLQDKKILVYTDINTSRKDQAAKVATNVLTKSMRPMYRNNIRILGRNIKPWDYIYLSDKFTDMNGVLDVERVVHHYDTNTGWTTNIIPHLVCEANPGNRAVQAAIFANRMDRIYDLVTYTTNGILAITAAPFGAALGNAALIGSGSIRGALLNVIKNNVIKGTGRQVATKAILKEGLDDIKNISLPKLKNIFTRDITKYFNRYLLGETVKLGVGETTGLYSINLQSGNDQLPLVMTPLIYKGLPLQAGMQGDESQYWSLGSRAYWFLNDTIDGYKDLAKELGTIFNPPNSQALEVQKAINQSFINKPPTAKQ